MKDLKGTEVRIDSLAEGLIGSTSRKARGRVYFISPFGWIAAWSEEAGQTIFNADRFLIREDPRPAAQRRDIPEHLQR